ncbi:MAG: hypothetical protein FWD44_01395 [Oscillospiraceae bacterium]|nr:hypothetical protein [Oscillospiraceae bacterium]
MKRIIAALLIVCMLTFAVAACSGGGGRNRGEVIDLVVYSQLANYFGEMIGWSAEVMLEEFNVRLQIINDGTPGTFQTRMENGFLGDIILFGSDGREYREASRAGLLFDWLEEDLLFDYGEYIWDHFETALNKNRAITGTLHGFGHNIAGNSSDPEAFFYYPRMRYDLYEKLGHPPINSLNDFIPVLEQMVALEPMTEHGTKTYAVSSFTDWDGDMVMMVKCTAALYGWEEFHIGLYHATTQEWEGALEPNGWYLNSLKWHNQLYQRGLYDPDAMTQDWMGFIEKIQNGAVMFTLIEWMGSAFNIDDNTSKDKMMLAVTANDQTNLVNGLNIHGGNRIWSIGANSRYPELAMEIINWFSTPEGTLIYNYGPKGVTWDYDRDGEPYMTELGLQTQQDKKTEIAYGSFFGPYEDGEFQHNNTTWSRDAVNPDSPGGNTFNYETWNSTLLALEIKPVEQRWRNWTGYNRADEWFNATGNVAFAVATDYTASVRSRDLNLTWEQVTRCIREGSWRAIYANSDAEFEQIVAQMIGDALDYGYDQCVEWILGEAQLRREAENRALGR